MLGALRWAKGTLTRPEREAQCSCNILDIATRMCSSIIGYSPTTTTLDICVIACRAASAIAAAATIQLECPLHLLTFRIALNSAQSHYWLAVTSPLLGNYHLWHSNPPPPPYPPPAYPLKIQSVLPHTLSLCWVSSPSEGKNGQINIFDN